MTLSEVTKYLRTDNKTISISAYHRSNILSFYTAKDFSDFIHSEKEKWENEVNHNPLWKLILTQIINIENLWKTAEETKNTDDLNNVIISLQTETSSRPYFIHSSKITDYINNVIKMPSDWPQIVLRLFTEPNSYSPYNYDYRICAIYSSIASMIYNYNHECTELKTLNTRTKEVLADVHKQLQQIQKQYQEEEKERDDKFASQYDNNNKSLADMIENHTNTLTTIETTYEEKVRIAKPSELWDVKRKTYSRRGIIWTVICFLVAIGISAIGFVFFKCFPNIFENTDSKEIINITGSIKWTILTGIGLGALIYMLRLSVKLALSSFHMARDAEEKCALTSFYLSLINDKALDPNNEKELKNIVMNALFARVDTGLLKGDTAPTMPTAGLSETLKLLNGR
jgi:hypothetical protein